MMSIWNEITRREKGGIKHTQRKFNINPNVFATKIRFIFESCIFLRYFLFLFNLVTVIKQRNMHFRDSSGKNQEFCVCLLPI